MDLIYESRMAKIGDHAKVTLCTWNFNSAPAPDS